MALVSLCDGETQRRSLQWWNDQRLGLSSNVLDWWRVVDGLIVVVSVYSHRPREAKAAPKGRSGGGDHLLSNHIIVGGVS